MTADHEPRTDYQEPPAESDDQPRRPIDWQEWHTAYEDPDSDLTKRLAELWTVLLPGLRPTPDPAARIATGQALRDRARMAAANSAPTTLVRTVDI